MKSIVIGNRSLTVPELKFTGKIDPEVQETIIPNLIEMAKDPEKVKELESMPDPRPEVFHAICLGSGIEDETMSEKAKELLNSEVEIWSNLLQTSQREFDWDTADCETKCAILLEFVFELISAGEEFLGSLMRSRV
jgi:hypothetical protein